MIKWINQWWNKRCRKIDIRVLWPSFQRESKKRGMSYEDAVLAFVIHTRIDPVWADVTEDEVREMLSDNLSS